jgi:putative phage-type endonuclease
MAYDIIADSSVRDSWLEARRAGIGGSDIPAILGLSSWQTPLSIYVDKIGLGDTAEQKEQQRWGILLEPIILREFGQETNRSVSLAGKLLRSQDLPIALCTLDGIQQRTPGTTGSVQIKNYGGYGGKWGEAVPPDVFAQCQWEMGVAEFTYCSAVALLNGNKMVWADIEYDDHFFSAIAVPAALEFWDRVQNGKPPAPDGSDISKAALAKLYPKDDGTEIELPMSFLELDAELQEYKSREKDRAAAIKALENDLRAAIGEHTAGLLPNGVLYTNRFQERAAHEVKASSFRVLRRTMKKG